MNNMEDLKINRNLDESQRVGEYMLGGKVYSLYQTNKEMILTENGDTTRIYLITTIEMWKTLFVF